MAELACIRSSITIIPIFENIGLEQTGFIINQTEVSTMCMEKGSIDKMVELKKTTTPSLQNLVCFDNVTDEEREKVRQAGMKLFTFQEIIVMGMGQGPHVALREP